MRSQISFVAVAAVCGSACGGTISVPLAGGGLVWRQFTANSNTNVFAPVANITQWGTTFDSFHSWMEFDLSAVPSGADITAVSFKFRQNGSNGLTVRILGDYTDGEMSYEELFGFSGSKTLQGSSLHTATVSDGVEFGRLVVNSANNGTDQNILLTSLTPGGAAGLAYFNAQIGNRMMLVGTSNARHSGTNIQPTLEITYTDAPVIPLPHAGGMAMAGLGLLAMRRRRA